MTLIGLAAALAFVGIAWPRLPIKVGALLSFDGFVLFGFALILAENFCRHQLLGISQGTR